jgi:hypothetical protein
VLVVHYFLYAWLSERICSYVEEIKKLLVDGETATEMNIKLQGFADATMRHTIL